MKRVKEFISSEWGFVFIVIFIALGISIYPTLWEYWNRGNIFPDRVFELIYSYTWDFHAYLSKILQGKEGGLLVYERFTSEPHAPSLLQIFYLMLGKIGGWFSFSGVTSYHVGRVAFGILWAIAGYLLIKFCFPKRLLLRKLSFLLFVFSGNFPKIVSDPNGYGFPFLGQKLEIYLPGWSHLYPSDRITFVPHWNAGHLLTVLTLLALWKWFSEKKFKWGIIAGVLGMAGGFILPPTLIISQVVFAFFSVYIFVDHVLKKRNIVEFIYSYLTVVPFWIFSAVSLIYNLWVTSFYPWKSLVDTDVIMNRIIFPWNAYLWGMGLTFPIGIIGALIALVFKREKLAPAFLWIFSTLLLIFVFDKFLVWNNQTRFVQVGIELPLAITTVFFLDFIFSFFKKLRTTLLTISVILILLPSVLTWAIATRGHIDFLKQKMLGSYPDISMGPYVVYPIRDVVSAISWVSENVGKNEVVFSGPAFGNYVGAYTNKTVYIGHMAQTVNYLTEKYPNAEKFYKGQLTEAEIKNIFKKHRIGFVVYGPEEKTWGEAVKSYKFLKKVWGSGVVEIYKVKF